MNLGDVVYDSDYGQHGMVVEVSECGEFCTVLYSDGIPDRGIRTNENGIEVISETR
jgi:hypothetical protein